MCMDPAKKEYTDDCDIVISSLWDELYEKKGTSNMAERFLYVIKHFSKNKNFNDIIETDEWLCDSENPDLGDDTKCICSQSIHYGVYIKSKLNGNILRVGNVCIKKMFGINSDIIDQAKYIESKNRYDRVGVGINRMCTSCLRYKISIDEPSYKTVCKSCYKMGLKGVNNGLLLDGKECVQCKKKVLKKDDWRTKCHSCYIKDSNSSNRDVIKKCLSCNFVLPDSEKWKMYCTSCYIKNHKNELK